MTTKYLHLFPEQLKESHGHYTDATLARCGQLVGPLSEAIDTIFGAALAENSLYLHRRRDKHRSDNVCELVSCCLQEKLFKVTPGRQHQSFPLFRHEVDIKNPERFGKKMAQLSDKLDKWRRVVAD